MIVWQSVTNVLAAPGGFTIVSPTIAADLSFGFTVEPSTYSRLGSSIDNFVGSIEVIDAR